MDDDCCGEICIHETVTSQRDVIFYNEGLSERVQIVYHSIAVQVYYNFRLLPLYKTCSIRIVQRRC